MMNALLNGGQQPPPLSSSSSSNTKNSKEYGALPFNKMFIMIPVMLAARKLNNDDVDTIYMIRIAYVIIQTICLSLALYAYIRVSSLPQPHSTTTSSSSSSSTNSNINRIIYVPAAPQPFADPNTTKKKYTETKLVTHLQSQARSLLGSTVFGIGMTCVLHYYKGMIMGLAIQAVMGPFNIWDNVLVRTLLLRGISVFTDPTTTTASSEGQELRIFDEKLSLQEMDPLTDEVVDEQGNPIVFKKLNNNNAIQNNGATTTNELTASKSLEEVMLDTWDQGATASLTELLSMLNSSNINTQTSEDGWTSLMIVSGLKCPHDVSAIQTMIQQYKADIAKCDNDGWTCLHWAAFHNSLTAATELYHHTALLHVVDNDGKTPLEIAQAENNAEIADLLQTVMNDTKKDK